MVPCIGLLSLRVALFCFVAAAVEAQTLPLPSRGATIPLAKIPRVTHPPKLGDFLEDRPREAELRITDFRQNSLGDGTPVTEATTAYLSYDVKLLYDAFLCHDPTDEGPAHLYQRADSGHHAV